MVSLQPLLTNARLLEQFLIFIVDLFWRLCYFMLRYFKTCLFDFYVSDIQEFTVLEIYFLIRVSLWRFPIDF